MLEEALFVFLLPRFTYSIRKQELSINKAYLCDTGFAKLVEIREDKGKKMENMVFLELQKRKKANTTLSYYKDNGYEVDFVVKEGRRVKQLIQVCYDISDLDTKKRETQALLKASKALKCKNTLIITYNHKGKEKINGQKITFIPLWKWLLEYTNT